MQSNLLAAWVGILMGFLSGLALGLCFHRENWLGGYGSFKRRLYRLAHISLFPFFRFEQSLALKHEPGIVIALAR
jgi:hypothetical protein